MNIEENSIPAASKLQRLSTVNDMSENRQLWRYIAAGGQSNLHWKVCMDGSIFEILPHVDQHQLNFLRWYAQRPRHHG